MSKQLLRVPYRFVQSGSVEKDGVGTPWSVPPPLSSEPCSSQLQDLPTCCPAPVWCDLCLTSLGDLQRQKPTLCLLSPPPYQTLCPLADSGLSGLSWTGPAECPSFFQGPQEGAFTGSPWEKIMGICIKPEFKSLIQWLCVVGTVSYPGFLNL